MGRASRETDIYVDDRARVEMRGPITYECVLNERTNRVVTAAYELRQRNRYSSLY